jgi:hypothetical protein
MSNFALYVYPLLLGTGGGPQRAQGHGLLNADTVSVTVQSACLDRRSVAHWQLGPAERGPERPAGGTARETGRNGQPLSGRPPRLLTLVH